MPLSRLTSRPPAAGEYTAPGAFNAWITLNNPANPTAGIVASPFSQTWAGIRAIGGSELDKMRQFAQRSTHLVTLPFQEVLEAMTLTFNDGDEIRTFQIEYIEDPDELGRELRAYCFEMDSNAGSGVDQAPPAPTLYQGSGPPTTLYTDGSTYWDQTSGNLYEQVYGEWVLVGNISGGGTPEMPSSVFHVVAAPGTNAANIKASAGTVTGWKVYNNANYPIFVKLYNKATQPVPGTDTPQLTIGVDAGESDVILGAGFTFATGIGVAITKGIADTDNTGVNASDCDVNIFWQ